MLAYIKGILEIKTKGYIVVEAGGLGYKIFMPESTIANTGNIGDKVQIYTFMRVREDDVSLYGFLTNEELRMFELLLSVSGIGAKGALGILSNITPSQFALAVISNDVTISDNIKIINSFIGKEISQDTDAQDERIYNSYDPDDNETLLERVDKEIFLKNLEDKEVLFAKAPAPIFFNVVGSDTLSSDVSYWKA